MTPDTLTTLRQHGIQPSAQRVAVADYVLHTDEHPSADTVWTRVRGRFPLVSRATIYNTLNLFVEKGLLSALSLGGGRVVFDPNTERHHHFIDDETGAIHDLPWDSLELPDIRKLDDYEIRECQVILRGRRRPARR